MNTKIYKILEYNKILQFLADSAVTGEAKKQLLALTPSVGFDEVEALQKATSQATSMLVMHGAAPIVAVPDIRAAVNRSKLGGVLSLSELLGVGAVLRCAKNLIAYMDKGEKFDILQSMCSNLTTMPDLQRDISNSILGEDTVADNASGELAALRRKILQLNNKIKDILNDMLRSAETQKYLQEPIVTMRGDRYVLPVKNENRNNVPGILHDTSATGATAFIEPMAVVQTNNLLRDVIVAEQREIERIIADFSARVALCADIILENYRIIIESDVLFTKASFCNKLKCTEPVLNREGQLVIKKGRHPLLDKKTVVPVDIYIGGDFDTLVITGPNTGGKTVTLKTVGLFALMCQSGLQLPADSGTIMPVYSNIFADIGDEQSIEQSLSTFSSHMVNIVDILNLVEPNTLALFDELGAGTDPDEGAALAIEILEYMRSCGASSIATTHYSELKMYALSTDRVENASCEFDVATLRPTYRLLISVPGKSNAFAISKRLGLYDTIIEKASARMTAESVRFEDIVSELQQKREAAATAYDEAVKMRNEAASLRGSLKKEKDTIKDRREKLLEDARREAQEIILKAQEETDILLKEARRLSAELGEKDSIRQMEQVRSEIRQKGSVADKQLRKNQQKSNTKISEIKLGMTIDILSVDERGTVLSLPNQNGDFTAMVGIMKLKTNVRDVKIVNDSSAKQGVKIIESRKNISSRSMNIKTELDLRGFTAYDAIMEVDKFIDDALLASLPKVSIIHGKGTGALRAALHDHLRKNKLVKTFRLGSYGEGDSGVTIIEFK